MITATPTRRPTPDRGPDAGAATPAGIDVEAQLPGLAIESIDSLAGLTPAPEFIARIPIAYARRWALLGCADGDGEHCMVLSSAADLELLDIVGRFLGWRPRKVLLANREDVLKAINAAYESHSGGTDGRGDETGTLVIDAQEIDPADVECDPSRLAEHTDLLDSADRSPVIRVVNGLLFQAIRQGASDIHFQPYEHELVVRLRIDGVLYDFHRLPRRHQDEIVSRIKIIGGMNIAEKRLAQDGRATVHVGDRVIDLRLSAVPTSFGERIVIRLLDKSARRYSLEEIGLPAGGLRRFRGLIRVEHGLLLVTGPTGSGKTTTLYAALKEIDAAELNVITLEDPIEYQLPGISQIQVNPRKGMNFAGGLRSVLRQDPDIIMVGEIRDEETAVMAIQSALTGHLVFSTLHTNDAASAVTRLLDLGIEPYLAASCLVGVMAQRLVRRICPMCAQPADIPEEEARWLGVIPHMHETTLVRKGRGCDECRGTGFRGRIGLFELLTVDEDIRHLIMTRASATQIKSAAVTGGGGGGARGDGDRMTTLRDDGLDKVLRGITTPDEVFRVTMRATV